ncbi:MAG: tRNA (adenosine(37)-N6)-threonylcarbamoyltransferase complex dimerization subunit type 1 TsaB [Bacteroidetes bacterium]|nr:tRNA (adenosine(37)-N6)-threonylcarbamoyltransferase complex dimerization subunit type 1 TsaB [Bacteroidota bacterium]
MSLILCLETATKSCSVSLGQNGRVLALQESLDERYSHAENLTLYIEEVCKQAKLPLQKVDAIAVSKGPGSFTGLRIGVSTAKGLCYALEKPLIAINTLEAMAVSFINQKPETRNQKHVFCPMIDARRMEVYCAVFDEYLNEIRKTSADIIDENSFADLLLKHKIIFLGDGAEKCRLKISHPNAIFINDIHPSARFMLPLAEKYFSEKKFEDLAYFEPFYLKDFVDTRPTK